MNTESFREADTERRLLQSIVDVTRHVFGAAAASIFLVDPVTSELVFQAVAGEGNGMLVGRRFPPGTGIAGCVATSGHTIMVDDLRESEQFAAEAAESTGYTPRCIIAAPLFRDDVCIGVLEVLDRMVFDGRELNDIDVLTLLADQAAIGLQLLTRLNHSGMASRSEQAVQLLEAAREILRTND
jgi:GAF domain-containing protein